MAEDGSPNWHKRLRLRTPKLQQCGYQENFREDVPKQKRRVKAKLDKFVVPGKDPAAVSKTIHVAFKIGHEVRLPSDSVDGRDCDWEITLSGQDGANIHHFIQKVVFCVNSSSSSLDTEILLPPFRIEGSGKRGTSLKCIINIHLKNSDRIHLEYNALMESTNSNHSVVEDYHFQNLSEEFEELLVMGGGVHTKPINWTKLLPAELIERVLANLGPGDLAQAGQVCGRWRDIAKSRRLWNRCTHHIVVDDMGPEDSLVLRAAVSLRSLSLQSILSTASGLNSILLQSEIVLTELYLHHLEPWSWEADFLLKQSKHLKKLSIVTRNLSHAMLGAIAAMNLEELILEGFKGGEEPFVFDPVPNSQLKNMAIRWLPLKTIRSLVLAHKTSLENFRCTDNLDAASFEVFTDCEKLKKMEIKARCNMQLLENMPALTGLTVVMSKGNNNFTVPTCLEDLVWTGRYSHVQLREMLEASAQIRLTKLTFSGDAGCLADEYTQSINYGREYGKQGSSMKELCVMKRFPQDVLCDILSVHRDTFEMLECKDLPSPAVWEALVTCLKLKELRLDLRLHKSSKGDNPSTRWGPYTVTSLKSSLQKLIVDGDIDSQTLSSLIGAHCSTLLTIHYHTSMANGRTPADPIMEAIARCVMLKKLAITRWSPSCINIVNLPCLKELHVDLVTKKPVTPFPIAVEELHLGKLNGNLNRDLLAALVRLPRLRVLSLPINDKKDVKGLSELKQLVPHLVVRRTGK